MPTFKGKIHLGVENMQAVFNDKNKDHQQTVTVSFSVKTTIDQIGRALHWQKMGYPMYLDIGSDYLGDDVRITKVSEQLSFIAEKIVPVQVPEIVAPPAVIEEDEAEDINADITESAVEEPAPEAKGKKGRKKKSNTIDKPSPESVKKTADPGKEFEASSGKNCDSCGYELSVMEYKVCEGRCPICGSKDITDIPTEKIRPGLLDNTFPILDLMTFDTRPSSTGVPAKFYLLKETEEAIDEDLIGAVVRLFNKCGVECRNAEELLAVLDTYPKTDGRDIAIGVLTGDVGLLHRDKTTVNN